VAIRTSWRFRLARTFFGLTSEYIQNVYEQFFYMKYYSNWSLMELYNLPVGLRKWYFDKLLEQKEKEVEAEKEAQRR
jgi:hypothetical protein